jgi:transcriptional regulator with XRE-family HTH domain
MPPEDFAALLERANLTQADFARLAGITVGSVNCWCAPEGGRRDRRSPPRYAVALALAYFYLPVGVRKLIAGLSEEASDV